MMFSLLKQDNDVELNVLCVLFREDYCYNMEVGSSAFEHNLAGCYNCLICTGSILISVAQTYYIHSLLKSIELKICMSILKIFEKDGNEILNTHNFIFDYNYVYM